MRIILLWILEDFLLSSGSMLSLKWETIMNAGYGKELSLLHVLHQCDNKLCVNPLHLRAGTEAENQQDKVAKGRQARGEKIHTAKLTEAKVRTILRKHKNGQSALSLSKEYGVCYGNMLNIVHRVTWKHVS
jgi:ketol-acid reductoisomerase